MITDFKFNHESNDFNESIGVSEDFQDLILIKVNRLVNDLHQIDELNQSRILEELVATCSDEQIAVLALYFIRDQLLLLAKNKKKS